MEEIARFSVTIDSELLHKFDSAIEERQYPNRSKAIRGLIRNFLVEREWEGVGGEVMGSLTLLYDHETKGTFEKLIDIQHDRCKNIISTMHIHLDEHNCMEIIVLQGLAYEVSQISDKLIGCKGVKHGKLILSSFGKEIG